MANYRRLYTPVPVIFHTGCVPQASHFCDALFRSALRQAIVQTRIKYPFAINAWVLLPNHLHTIWTLPQGDANYSLRWQQIKRKVSRTIGAEYNRAELLTPSKIKHRESTIWQRRYWEHQIRNQVDFNHHLDYCHYNPVKHRLCQNLKIGPTPPLIAM